MNLDQIGAFVAVAETGSIGAAAHRLGLTQPAVTRQIQNLERALQAKLLDRRSKPPTLTPAGRIALEHCRHMLRLQSELKDSVSETSQPTGNFRLGVAFGATDLVLAKPIDLLRKSFPELKIEITTNWTRSLIEQTQAGSLDGAIILRPYDRPPPSELNGSPISSDEIIIAAAKSSVLSPKTEIGMLSGFTWVMNPRGCWYRDALQEILAKANISLHVAIETFGLEFQLSLIARGVGLGFVPQWAVERSAYRDKLKIVRIRDYDLKLRVWAIQSGFLGRLAPALKTLEDAISKEF